jgi:hypothetical protein
VFRHPLSHEAVNPKFMGFSIASLDTADQLPRCPAGERPKV